MTGEVKAGAQAEAGRDGANRLRVAVIGFGEVGGIFGGDLAKLGAEVGAYDILLDGAGAGDEVAGDNGGAARLRRRADDGGVALFASAAAAVAGRALVISAVTADATLEVARTAAPHLAPGALFLDLNSASPGVKQAAAEAVEAAGGRYVEAAVMTSVPPYRLAVPMLLGGPHAADCATLLAGYGTDMTVGEARIGVASATKMCRSVVTKGLEALIVEGLSAARHYGVEDKVMASLAETFPGIDWEKQAAYLFSRVVLHGRRRAAEMRESARTVDEAGFDPWMTAATAERQQWVADLTAVGVFTGLDSAAFDWRQATDAILAADKARRRGPGKS